MAANDATKEAIRSLTWTASHEWEAYGITVNCVLLAILIEALADNHMDPKQMQALLSRLPIGHLGDPEHDTGDLIVFLASVDSSYFIGGTLILDGGAAQ